MQVLRSSRLQLNPSYLGTARIPQKTWNTRPKLILDAPVSSGVTLAVGEKVRSERRGVQRDMACSMPESERRGW